MFSSASNFLKDAINNIMLDCLVIYCKKRLVLNWCFFFFIFHNLNTKIKVFTTPHLALLTGCTIMTKPFSHYTWTQCSSGLWLCREVLLFNEMKCERKCLCPLACHNYGYKEYKSEWSYHRHIDLKYLPFHEILWTFTRVNPENPLEENISQHRSR